MGEEIPALLFRVISDESNGTNSTTLLEPTTIVHLQCDTKGSLSPNCGDKLEKALKGKKVADNMFVFFTSSLLFALAYAGFMLAHGRKSMRIICIDTSTARTKSGDAVNFFSAEQLMDMWEVVISNRDGSRRLYDTEYVAMSSVVPGSGSRSVSLQALIDNGLHELYPELREVNKRRNPKWYRAIMTFRQYWFSKPFSLTTEKIDVATRLASSFESTVDVDKSSAGEWGSASLTAWFLALQKRNENDGALATWLSNHTGREKENGAAPHKRSASTGVPEIHQYAIILDRFTNLKLSASKQSTPRIDETHVQEAITGWEDWTKERYAEHRASRTSGRDGDSRGRRGGGRRRKQRYGRSRSPERERTGGSGRFRNR